MLRFNKETVEKGEVAPLMHVGGVTYEKSTIPVGAAQELLAKAGKVDEGGRPGFEVRVDGRHCFPKDAFEEAPVEPCGEKGRPAKNPERKG